jgi:hypothetical protein
MRRAISLSTVTLIVGLVLAGCANSTTAQETDVSSLESESAKTREERIELRRQMQPKKDLDRFEQEHVDPVTGEVPAELLGKVYEDLERRTGGDRSDFELLRGESVQWNDGALGCAEPGQVYTQALVAGFWIVINYQGKQYDYRASDRGFFKLCETVSFTQGPDPQ